MDRLDLLHDLRKWHQIGVVEGIIQNSK